MSMLNKYLRNTTNSYSNKFNAANSAQHSSTKSLLVPTSKMMGNNNDRSKSGSGSGFEFKPFSSVAVNPKQQAQESSTNGPPSLSSARSMSKFNTSGSSKSENLVNNLLHSTSRNGKISKRKSDKATAAKKLSNFGLIQCFNLTEKEKFRQLISQNVSKASFDSKNLYQNLIKSSPTKIRDDNIFELRKNLSTNSPPKSETSRMDKYNLSKVSTLYTRRINLAPLVSPLAGGSKRTEPMLSVIKPVPAGESNRSRRLGATSRNDDESIIELLDDGESSTPMPLVVKKVAQKRSQIPQINLADDDDDDEEHETAATKQADVMAKLANCQLRHKPSRPLTEFEKRINDKLNRTTNFLESIFKPQLSSSAFLIEEERYKFKKRQRMDRERIEKELASKFTNQLRLESTRLTQMYLREEEKVEEEDDFPELSDEQEAFIESALVPYPQDEIIVTGFNADIKRCDIQTLRGLNWLNDEIVNFYMKLICERSNQATAEGSAPTAAKRCFAFSTFFYPKLVKEGYSQMLKRWTRKVDLFAHDLILIPVHLGLHWTLAVIDFTCQEIRYYDSMNGFNNDCLKLLKNYLRDEHADKKGGEQLDLSKWNCIHVRDVPQQMNGSDCGMFACKYAEYLSRGRNQFNFNQSHMPYFRRRMIWEIGNKKLM